MLGDPERDGSSGEPLDYESWTLYQGLERARAEGRATPYCLGIGLDALTLTSTVLTVVVIDDDVFDELFGEAVSINSEGSLVSTTGSTRVSDGISFTSQNVERLLREEPLASPASCILSRSMKNLELLIGS